MRVPVDPYADAVLITSFESEIPGQIEASIEEAYINIRKLPFMPSPLGLKFQVGRFRPPFGKFKLLHTHDLPQSTRSLLTQEFLGEEGFISQGVSTDFFLPTPWSENEALKCETPGAHRRRRCDFAGFQSPPGIPGKHSLVQDNCGNAKHRSRMVQLLASGNFHDTDCANARHRFHVPMEAFSPGRVEVVLLGGEAMFSDPVASPSEPGVISVRRERAFSRNGNSIAENMQAYVSTTRRQSRIRQCSEKVLTPYFSYYFSEFLRAAFQLRAPLERNPHAKTIAIRFAPS